MEELTEISVCGFIFILNFRISRPKSPTFLSMSLYTLVDSSAPPLPLERLSHLTKGGEVPVTL